MAVLTMISDLSDFGVNTSMVRFASIFLKKNEFENAEKIFNLNFKFKIFSGIIIAIIGYLISPFLSIIFFKNQNLLFPLRISFLGIIIILVFSFFLGVFQAQKKFFTRVFWGLMLNIGRVIFLILLICINKVNVNTSLLVYLIVPFLIILIIFNKKPFKFSFKKGIDKQLTADLFRFSRWITIANIAGLILSKLDIFLLSRLAGMESVGLYNSAFRLGSFILLINSSFTVTLLPEVFRFSRIEEIKLFYKKLLKFLFIITILLTPLIFFGPFLIRFVYGSQYLSAGLIFQVLVLVFIAMVFISALEMIIYAFNKPEFFAYLMVVSVFLSAILNYILIPKFGAVGAAWALFLVKLFGIIYLGVIIFWFFLSRKFYVFEGVKPDLEEVIIAEEKISLEG